MSKNAIFNIDAEKAKEFFLRQNSYANFDLPSYIRFEEVLKKIDNSFTDKTLTKNQLGKAAKLRDVNYSLYIKKNNSEYRKLQLINPFLYVSLINLITEKENWQQIQNLFNKKVDRIKCESIPIYCKQESNSKIYDPHGGFMISNWIDNVQNKSIELFLEYNHIIHVDIQNCYPSLYTHSISWALNEKGKEGAKSSRKFTDHFSNRIDSHIQAMQYAQTNGIPQGSILMDFICEMVLKYNDIEIEKEIKRVLGCKDYHIIRFRDDYRIFTKNKEDGLVIVKIINKSLGDCNFYLKESKVVKSFDIIKSSFKVDKYNSFGTIEDFTKKDDRKRIFEKALILKEFSEINQNSGVLSAQMNRLHSIILKNKKKISLGDVKMASVLTDLAINNPKSSTAILSIISIFVKNEDLFIKICQKTKEAQNYCLEEIWLQRIAFKINRCLDQFKDNDLCSYLEIEKRRNEGEEIPQICNIFNLEWIDDKEIKKILESTSFFNKERYDDLSEEIDCNEYSKFPGY